MFDPEDLRLAMEAREAEEAIVAAALACYEHSLECTLNSLPPMLVAPIRRLAEVRAARAARR